MIRKLVFIISFNIIVIIIISSCRQADNHHLKEYVHHRDPAFRYEIIDTLYAETWKEYYIKMVSGTWLTEKEVNHTEWWHWVTIVVPNNVLETEALLFIGVDQVKIRSQKKHRNYL